VVVRSIDDDGARCRFMRTCGRVTAGSCVHLLLGPSVRSGHFKAGTRAPAGWCIQSSQNGTLI
jgi:hypothetical protein